MAKTIQELLEEEFRAYLNEHPQELDYFDQIVHDTIKEQNQRLDVLRKGGNE